MNDAIAQLIFLIIKAVLMSVLVVMMVAFVIFFERKFAGFFQGRVGPTYLGPGGAFQSFGDIFKLLSKEDLDPGALRQVRLQAGAVHHLRAGVPGDGGACRSGPWAASPTCSATASTT